MIIKARSRDQRRKFIYSKYVRRRFCADYKDDGKDAQYDVHSASASLADNLTKTASKAMLEYVGVLTIKLIGGDTLAARDLSGRSDPYVIFTVGDQQVQSKVKFQTLQPVWNESFQVCVASLDDRLNLHVMDWDRIGKHDPMGDGSIRLEDLEDGKPTYKSVKLEHVECGTIHLQLTWTLLA